MMTFVVVTSCKVTPSSGEGSFNTPRVIDWRRNWGFWFFLFKRRFLNKNELLFFKERGNELGKTKKERRMTADSKDKPKVSVVSFQK